jgi:hypothetical protein
METLNRSLIVAAIVVAGALGAVVVLLPMFFLFAEFFQDMSMVQIWLDLIISFGWIVLVATSVKFVIQEC